MAPSQGALANPGSDRAKSIQPMIYYMIRGRRTRIRDNQRRLVTLSALLVLASALAVLAVCLFAIPWLPLASAQLWEPSNLDFKGGEGSQGLQLQVPQAGAGSASSSTSTSEQSQDFSFSALPRVAGRRVCAYNYVTRTTMCDRNSNGTAVLNGGSPNGLWALVWTDGNPRLLYSASKVVRWNSNVRLNNAATGCSTYVTAFSRTGAMTLTCKTTVWATFTVKYAGRVATWFQLDNTGRVRFYTANNILVMTIFPSNTMSPAAAFFKSVRLVTTTRSRTRTKTPTRTKTTSSVTRTRSTTSRTGTRTQTGTRTTSSLSRTATRAPTTTTRSLSRTATATTSQTKTKTYTTFTTVNPSLVPRWPVQKEVGTYFPQWAIYDQVNYTVRDMSLLTNAGNLTFVNYAFGNIYPDGNGGYKCDSISETDGNDGTGGDAWADYQKDFTTANSVDGVADVWNQRLAGNFNQLKKFKVKYPNIRVLISIGGWSWSKYFSAASANQELRARLVSSCIDVYLKGNLPVVGDRGGVGVGAGVFDGIDIDWEYPAVQGVGYNTVSPDDTVNYNLLLGEFRRQLDELSVSTGKAYGLTVAVGATKNVIDNSQPAEYSKFIDWANIMTYDFHGAWGTTQTGFHSNLYSDPAAPDYAWASDLSADAAVTYLLGKSMPANKIAVGIPAYGRGWYGVTGGGANNGVYQSALGPAEGQFTQGESPYRYLKSSNGTLYLHNATQQSYKWDSAGGIWWSYDSPAVVDIKASYAKSKGLRGLFSWSIDQDTTDGELLAKMANVRY